MSAPDGSIQLIDGENRNGMPYLKQKTGVAFLPVTAFLLFLLAALNAWSASPAANVLIAQAGMEMEESAPAGGDPGGKPASAAPPSRMVNSLGIVQSAGGTVISIQGDDVLDWSVGLNVVCGTEDIATIAG